MIDLNPAKTSQPRSGLNWTDFSREEVHALMQWDSDFWNWDDTALADGLKDANPKHHESDFDKGDAAESMGRDGNPHEKGSPRWNSWDAGWMRGLASQFQWNAGKAGQKAAKEDMPRMSNPLIEFNPVLLDEWDGGFAEKAREIAEERRTGYQRGFLDRISGCGERETQDHADYYVEAARGWDDADRGGEAWIDANWDIVKDGIMREAEMTAMARDPLGPDCPHSGPFYKMGGRFRDACREGYWRLLGGDAAYRMEEDEPSTLDGNPCEEGTDEFGWWRLGFIFTEGQLARHPKYDDEINDWPESLPLDANPHDGEDGEEWARGWKFEDGIECDHHPGVQKAREKLVRELEGSA